MKVSEMTNEELVRNFSKLQSENAAWNISKEMYLEQDALYRDELLRRLNAEPGKPRCEDARKFVSLLWKTASQWDLDEAPDREQLIAMLEAQFFPAERQEGWAAEALRHITSKEWDEEYLLAEEELYWIWLKNKLESLALPAPPSAPTKLPCDCGSPETCGFEHVAEPESEDGKK